MESWHHDLSFEWQHDRVILIVKYYYFLHIFTLFFFKMRLFQKQPLRKHLKQPFSGSLHQELSCEWHHDMFILSFGIIELFKMLPIINAKKSYLAHAQSSDKFMASFLINISTKKKHSNAFKEFVNSNPIFWASLTPLIDD